MPAAREAAAARAAKPAAELARPAASGTVLVEVTLARCVTPERSRTRSRKRVTRASAVPPGAEPLILTASASPFPPSKETVVVVQVSSRVRDRLEVVGIISDSSALPQYLMSAIFVFALAVAVCAVGAADVEGAEGVTGSPR